VATASQNVVVVVVQQEPNRDRSRDERNEPLYLRVIRRRVHGSRDRLSYWRSHGNVFLNFLRIPKNPSLEVAPTALATLSSCDQWRFYEGEWGRGGLIGLSHPNSSGSLPRKQVGTI